MKSSGNGFTGFFGLIIFSGGFSTTFGASDDLIFSFFPTPVTKFTSNQKGFNVTKTYDCDNEQQCYIDHHINLLELLKNSSLHANSTWNLAYETKN